MRYNATWCCIIYYVTYKDTYIFANLAFFCSFFYKKKA